MYFDTRGEKDCDNFNNWLFKEIFWQKDISIDILIVKTLMHIKKHMILLDIIGYYNVSALTAKTFKQQVLENYFLNTWFYSDGNDVTLFNIGKLIA